VRSSVTQSHKMSSRSRALEVSLTVRASVCFMTSDVRFDNPTYDERHSECHNCERERKIHLRNSKAPAIKCEIALEGEVAGCHYDAKYEFKSGVKLQPLNCFHFVNFIVPLSLVRGMGTSMVKEVSQRGAVSMSLL
jgi:hypothetical protein